MAECIELSVSYRNNWVYERVFGAKPEQADKASDMQSDTQSDKQFQGQDTEQVKGENAGTAKEAPPKGESNQRQRIGTAEQSLYKRLAELYAQGWQLVQVIEVSQYSESAPEAHRLYYVHKPFMRA